MARVRCSAVLIGCLLLVSCRQEPPPAPVVTLTGPTMGTEYHVKISRMPVGVEAEGLHADIKGILQRINDRMSTYQDDSELSRFNREQRTDWFSVSAETVLVVQEALRVSRLTDGAFDVTVGPLVNLWSFGSGPRTQNVPAESAIRAALQSVGHHRIQTRTSPPAIKKARPDMQVDLSAIAKGYAVDQVAERLASAGITNYLVEIGGELRVQGRKAPETPWAVGIEQPTPGQRAVKRVVHLENQALATSGDYRNYFEQNGKRYSHTINPRTGKPITHTLASVSVLHPSCMRADALATGFMVLGPEAAYDLAVREDVAAYFIIRSPEGFQEKSTPALRNIFSQKQATP